MKKRLMSIMLTVALLCTALPLQAAAAGATIQPAAATAQGLQDAMDAAGIGDTVKLNADITVDATMPNIYVTKSMTLDLNGYTLSYSVSGTDNTSLAVFLHYTATGTFTVTDSSLSGDGQITSDSNYIVLIHNAGSGTIAYEKGTISTSGVYGIGIINVADGRIYITGGTVSSDVSFAVYNGNSAGTVDITGGTISTSSGFTVINNGIVNMSGGTLSGNAGIGFHNQKGATFLLTGGSVSSTSSFGVNNLGRFTMEGGSIATQSSNGLSNVSDDSISDISGGTIHSDTGPAIVNYAGIMNISDGTITSGGDCAVINYGIGTVNITGGEISANRVTFYNNSTGTISINQGTFASAYNNTGTLKINGGSIKTVSTTAPVNDAGTSLVLYTFVLKDTAGALLADTDLSSAALTFTPAASPAYNMNGVVSDANGKIYVWLPADKTAVNFSFGALSTNGVIVDYRREIVIPNFSGTVTINRDDVLWQGTANPVVLSQSNTSIYTINGAIDGTLQNGVYTFRGLDSSKTYYVWPSTYGFQCSDQIITKDDTSATLDLYSISLSAGEGITGTMGSGFTILKGDSLNIRAAVATGYTFSKWVKTADGALISTDAAYKIEDIRTPWNLTAMATLNLFAATVTVKKDNAVWDSGAPVIKLSESGIVQEALRTTTGSGGVYTFTDLNPTKTYYVWDTTHNQFTGQTINKNTAAAAVDYYTVALTSGTGVSDVTGEGTFLKGSSVPLTATVLPNFAWSQWAQTTDSTVFSTIQNDTVTNISAPYALTATATSTIFDATVTVKCDDNPWAAGNPVMVLSDSNTVISNQLSGTPSSGVYTFTSLSQSKTYYVWDATHNQYTGQTVLKNMNTSVVDYYTVTLTNGLGVSEVSGSGTFMKGSNVPISAVPASTYLWSKWIQTSDDATLSTQQAYTITGINKSYALTALGSPDVYQATVTVNKNDNAWTAAGTPGMVLSESSASISNQVNGILSGGIYTFSDLLRATNYFVWDTKNNKYTGQLINKNTTSAVVDYYSVALTDGSGISDTTGSDTYMKGSNVPISATILSNFVWNHWAINPGGAVFSTAKDATITNVNMQYALTAKATANYSGDVLNVNGDSIIINDSANSGYISILQGSTTYDNIDPATNITIEGGIATTNTITVNASLGAVITLKNVNISTTGTAPLDITSSAGAVTVDLAGANTLQSNTIGFAGLQKANGGRAEAGLLTIQSTTGTGTLFAKGAGATNTNGAGIGGFARDPLYGDGSYVTITGGTITANGGYRNAGIGGSHITISGGNVTATGGSQAAGIGGVFWGAGNDITITGGIVNATGGSSAAGIGGGFAGNANNITITGGTVTATGGTYGIGGGASGQIGAGNILTNFVVTGGNIKATFNSTPKNAIGGSNVYKATFTVDGALTDYTDVSENLVIRDLNDNAYGMSDVATLDTDKIYAYLPVGNASAAYNLVDYATVVSTGSNAEFGIAYVINIPDDITLEGITAAVSFGNAYPLRAGGLSVTANVVLSGIANKRGVYTIALESGTVAISPASQTKSVTVGDTVSETRSFTFTMTSGDISDLMLRMTFDPKPIHTVTYTASDATGGGLPAQIEVYEGDTYTVANQGSLLKTGYTFVSWLNGTTNFSGTKTMGIEDVTLSAKWAANTYTVNFNANGGSGAMSGQSLSYNQTAALSENTFSKTGYTFSGWSNTPGGIKVYNDRQNVSNLAESGAVTLYAMWTANRCTVSFDANGGSGTMLSQVFTYDTAQSISSNTFTKPGYTFDGWAETPGGAKIYNNNQSISDIALNGALTLYARWMVNNYTIVFDANGGSGAMAPATYTYDLSAALPASSFSKPGYTFYGWAETATGEVACDDQETVSNLAESGTVTLYALWTESRFTVVFNPNGGNGTMSNQMYTYDAAQALSQSAFTKSGYTFAGWATTPGGAKAYDDEQSVSNLAESGTVNLYARWTVNSYQIAFQANGGIGTMSNQSFTYDVAQSLSSNGFTQSNHTFIGWATDLEGAKVYNNGQSVINIAQRGTVTIYAVWQAKTAIAIDEAPKSFSYDGNVKAYPISGVPNMGYTVTYKQNGSTVVNPIQPGTYDVVITRGEDGAYASYSKTINAGLVISKVQAAAFSLATPKNTFTSFDITTQDLGTLVPSDFTITFGGISVVATAVSPYAGGKYTVTIPSQTADSVRVLSVQMNDTLANYLPYSTAVAVTPTVNVTGISFHQTGFHLAKDSSQTLAILFNPSTATNRTVTWESSDTSIASVTAYGVVTGIITGTVTITATTQDGNKMATCTIWVYLPSSGSGSGSTNFDAPVTVDGKTENIGKIYQDGIKTTVILDNEAFEKQLGSAKEGASTIIPIDKNDIATARLVLKNVEDMAQKNMILAIQTEGIFYNIRTDAIDTGVLREDFPGVDTKDISFEVTIEQAEYAAAYVPSDTEIVFAPISFNIIASYNGKSAMVDNFSRFVERTVEITEEQARRITTAVVVGTDGSLRHVPTSVFQKDGKYYATISSVTNSVYAFIENEVEFSDAQGKWYEKAVNEMAGRKIINGIGSSNFGGERNITRAEFAAILVRALGLPTNGTGTFVDVAADAWYSGAVATAAQYGFVGGRGANRFDPAASITRQEAMAMIQRAAKCTDYVGQTTGLSLFSDSGSIAGWALESAKWNVGSGLIMGSNGRLRPTASISRAETATIILRLLQTSELVDVRN